MTAVWHPRPDDQGQPVRLRNPSVPSEPSAWSNTTALARVVPDGPLPAILNGLPLIPWRQVPENMAAWEALAATMSIAEPSFNPPKGLKAAAGVVACEPDGRVWVVAPSNAFGGYQATFPKGRLDGKSLKATALVETFEETGLQVQLTGFLVDVPRSSSYTRYFLGQRIGGTPADMGWESQAVMLVPIAQLPKVVNNESDMTVIAELLAHKASA